MQGAQILGYEDSPNFLVEMENDFPYAQELGYILRQAKDKCGLYGVYVLRHEDAPSPIPILYYCRANTETEAQAFHRLIWNQGLVPFVLIETEAYLRVYLGFQYSASPTPIAEASLLGASPLHQVNNWLAGFQAREIDDGTLWTEWGTHVTPETRVDWTLLNELRKLDVYLQSSGLSPKISHILIGKFIYLRYLRDRAILSDEKLAQWGISFDSVFSRNATLDCFLFLDKKTNEWLNGSIFPSDGEAISTIPSILFKRIAGVFVGDKDEQLHLDFQPYDFAFIPVEMLSVIYQQFLHVPDSNEVVSRGRKIGAYYTPSPLISFMLEELERKKPLTNSTKILDPACGSGSFLVQCYRRLIEKQRQQARRPLRPSELREILTKQIFGVEQDSDACSVAELSLILTFLDYINREDLENNLGLLPSLRNRNIFQADFFAPDSSRAMGVAPKTFDWIVGNPPWYDIKSKDVPNEFMYIWKWIKENSAEYPVGGNQVAEAFSWKILSYLNVNGLVGFVLPAMTLFKKESTSFRKQFFTTNQVWCVANFSNLAEVLFAGRSRRPAIAIFFRPRNGSLREISDEFILTYAPLIVNQETNRTKKPGKRKFTWSITINSGEIQEVPTAKAVMGDMLPWKLAMWGSFRDEKLLRRVGRFPLFKDFCRSQDLEAHQGFPLKERTPQSEELLEARPELEGKLRVDFNKLRRRGKLFVFPTNALVPISKAKCNIRIQGGEAGIRVSEPPHVIVDAGRRFAVYSDKFIAIPHPHIGIIGSSQKVKLLKALSLYLSSDFSTYQQFFTSQEWGISTSRATLYSLKHLPVPLEKLSESELTEWADLQDYLAETSQKGYSIAEKMDDLNNMVFQVLELHEPERILIKDFVAMNMQCIQGKVTKPILSAPTESVMRRYATRLKDELDNFIEGQSPMRHEVFIRYDRGSAMVGVRLKEIATTSSLSIKFVDIKASHEFDGLRQRLNRRHSQWLYFKRNLRIYDQDTIYCFKPMHAIHWTERQAILDASEVISETLISEEKW